ncbi:MAG: FHA domain-containing protein [Gammaproteobacteria bacterium]|nr:FHA domain-containing protein [Gammaproteobacteria bacterium]MDH5652783.1 FHA domain-containing protein [Gammaproteobacteria bacterium]
MAKLILTLDGAVIREYEIDKDSISIGRKHGNDIQLNDLTISGRHALITTLGEHAYVDDLGSTNGTLLNGARIAKAQLKHGDTIQTGNYQFTYFSELDSDYEPTMFLRAEIEDTQIMDMGGQNQNETKGEPLAGVRVMNGPLAKKVLELRKPFNTLGFNGDKLAMITRNTNGYTISAIRQTTTHNPNTRPPILNGNPISIDPIKLNDHDVLELAGTKMEFFYLH